MIYLNSLPFDLLRELSCYLNYPTTNILLQLCNITNRDIIWKYKINKELNYEFEKTVLPLDQKYLQVKVQTDIDIGCEVFLRDLSLAYYKVGKKSDIIERQELLDYLQNLPIIQSMEEIRSCEIALLIGALETNNKDLIEEYKHHLTINAKVFAKEFLNLFSKSETKTFYFNDVMKLVEVVYIIKDRELQDKYETFFLNRHLETELFDLSVKGSQKGYALFSSDDQITTYIKTYEGRSMNTWLRLYISLIEVKRYTLADLLYEKRINTSYKSATINTEIVNDLISTWIATDDMKYISLIQDWIGMTSILNILNSRYMYENIHKFYNLKNLDSIWNMYIEELFDKDGTLTIIYQIICNALRYGYLDFVEWAKNKIPLDKTYINTLVQSIHKDKSRIYPDFILNYLKTF